MYLFHSPKAMTSDPDRGDNVLVVSRRHWTIPELVAEPMSSTLLGIFGRLRSWSWKRTPGRPTGIFRILAKSYLSGRRIPCP